MEIWTCQNDEESTALQHRKEYFEIFLPFQDLFRMKVKVFLLILTSRLCIREWEFRQSDSEFTSGNDSNFPQLEALICPSVFPWMPTLFFYNLNGRRRKFESVDKRPGVDARTHHLSWNTSSNSFPDWKHLTRNEFVTDYFRTCTAHVFHYFEICMVWVWIIVEKTRSILSSLQAIM